MESEYNSVRRGTALRGKKRGAHAVHRNGGSTGVLKLRDDCGSVWYDGENSRRRLGEDTFYLPWEYPKKPRKSLLYQWFSSLEWRLLHHNYTICERALV